MKKILFTLALPLVFLSTLPAQVTQNEADTIVLNRIGEMEHCDILYAIETLQTEGTTITTSPGETLELDYSCWVYFMNFAGETNNKYLIVKENNGNLLEINTTNDGGPENLAAWRVVPREVLFEDYSLNGTSCQWKKFQGNYTDFELIIINSNEELESYVNCTEGSTFPEIDFSIYTLLLARGVELYFVRPNYTNLQQLSAQGYVMKVNLRPNLISVITYWQVPIIIDKINSSAAIELIVTKNP